MFGISGAEFAVIILVAVIVVGPQRLPEYTRKLTQLVRQLRVYLDNARTQIAEEVGPELADLDLSDLDPRQYDPRKIVRDALGEDLDAIREDLAHPFRSVSAAAKETSEAAAGAVKEAVSKERADSLSKRITEKKEEAKAASTTAAAKTAARDEPEETAQAAEPGQADRADSADSAESAERATEPGQAEPAAPAESAPEAGQDDAGQDGQGPTEAEDAQEADADAQAPVPASTTAESTESAEPTGSTDDLAEPTVPTVPVSLAEAEGPAPAARPVSPRDIVRAANAAARTRQAQ
ncbi:twin-arginine translocase TatA/TatE family subunit [Actinomyces slackii]|uniref:twin-arginine translocase TatA/TatE family subunit n=1 Tax=Actinomyces slackii TaxID=52774 RepID=UPI0004163447|nr:twin-arginine translocase TatA/TatE family subunit [Actinomyces slackii]